MNVVVVGAQWGDEGKGKVVDLLSENADVIVRFQGGNNAGHTLIVNGKKTVLHLIPSGILHPGKQCLIANGVVFDPTEFFKELEELQSQGVFQAGEAASSRIKVSERAHVILPYHRLIDQLREAKASKDGGKGKIGTTGRGIGPAYEDKVARRGIQVIDLLRPEWLRRKIETAIAEKNALLKSYFESDEVIDLEKTYQECLVLGEKMKPFIADVRGKLMEAFSHNQSVLFEGAQGSLLDVDHGTYPFVTSSSTIVGGALTGTGIGPKHIQEVVGLTKAYTTRVGTGPFPSEIEESDPEVATLIRTVGKEFGATTGRARRVGWLDLVALKYAVEINGITSLALMKADVLNGFDCVKICTSYRLASETIYSWPASITDLENVEASFEVMPGWPAFDASKVKHFEDLPQELQSYVRFIENAIEVPLCLVSIGPGRDESVVLKKFF